MTITTADQTPDPGAPPEGEVSQNGRSELREEPPESAASTGTSPPVYAATVPRRKPHLLKPEVGAALVNLQEAIGMPVWLLIQNDPEASHLYHSMTHSVYNSFLRARHDLEKCKKIALVIDSPGGSAESAYQIAKMLGRHTGYVAVVPRYAKSAATLLALGAEKIYMGYDAELGPLDSQLLDRDREQWGSALDEVQALERLNVAALEQFDQAMQLMLQRTGKKMETLLPHALHFAAEMMRPLLDKIDTVHYSQQARILKVGEDYAVRLLQPHYGKDAAEIIAREFVNAYSEHEFVIDREEASELLELGEPTPAQAQAIDELEELLSFRQMTAIGRFTTISTQQEGGNNDDQETDRNVDDA